MVNYERIKQLMEEKGITNKALADAVGVSDMMVGYIIRGLREPSLTILARMAKVLDCTTASLIED